VPVRLLSYRTVRFRVQAMVRRDPLYLAEDVQARVEAALLDRFSFAARDFGQRVALSEVVAVIQGVSGVIGVDVDLLYVEDEPPTFRTALQAHAPAPGSDATRARPAELLTLVLQPGDITVTD
jgi:hypothetical protein